LAFNFFHKKNKSNIQNLTDEVLVELYIQQDDLDIFAILFQRYTHLIYGVCLKYLRDEEESKDAVMQLFEDVAEKLKKHEIQHFKNWLYSVTKNHCLMLLRSRKSYLHLKGKIILENVPDFMEFDEILHLNENSYSVDGKLENALISLKEEHRICIRLMYYENKSYREITEITGYSLNEVKSYIQNGKRNLKNFMIGGR
jgi:RNA polymerase sigma factor (sigma-70 family)